MTDTPTLRKERGAFFTPPVLAEFLANWAVRSPTDRVLEPSCGEAAFLLAAARRLRDLGGTADQTTLHGAELHEPSAHAARDLLLADGADASVTVGDFLSRPATPSYAAAIGNPPYVRYQSFAGANRAAGQRAALAAGVRINGLASAWAPFVVHAAEHLTPDGRLALVLPAELLTVSYAAEVRRYLLRRFADVRLIVFDQRVFPGVLEEIVLLLAEGTGPTDHFKLRHVASTDALADAENFAWVSTVPEPDAKWTSALLDNDLFDSYRDVVARDGFTELAAGWGKTSLGAVTGNNNWFALTQDRARSLGITRKELLPLSPPGSRHLRGLTFSPAAWDALAKSGRRVYLFYPGKNPSAAAKSYIAAGEAAGIDDAYKCRVRSPWWRVPLAPPADLLLTYMNHIAPQLTTNKAQVRYLNSVHGVVLDRGRRKLGRDLLPLAALNSVSLAGAEMVGRSYGGGMLKLEPREADQWPLPSVELLRSCEGDLRALRPQLTTRLRRGDLIGASELVDKVLLRAAGLRVPEVKAIRTVRHLLFSRREARGSS